MELGIANYALWIAGPLLEAVVLVQMLRRGWHCNYPVFFSYLVLNTVRSPFLYSIFRWSHGYGAYFYSYWMIEAASIGLGFAVIWEVFSSIFRPYEGLRSLAGTLYRLGAVGLLIVAILSVAMAPAADRNWLAGTVVLLDRSLRLIQVGLLLLLFALSRYFRLSLAHLAFGIALGFGLSASIQLAVVAMRTYYGTPAGSQFTLLAPAAFTCGVLVWLLYTLGPQKEPADAKPIQASLPQVERWNQALLELLNR